MKKYNGIILIAMAVFAFKAKAQEEAPVIMEYTYDESGNRVSRTLFVSFLKTLPANGSTTAEILHSQPVLSELLNQPGDLNVTESRELRPNVYPNPTTDYVTIELLYNVHQISPANTLVSIYDGKGTLVHTIKTSGNRELINFGELASGKYLVIIQSDKNKYLFNIQKN